MHGGFGNYGNVIDHAAILAAAALQFKIVGVESIGMSRTDQLKAVHFDIIIAQVRQISGLRSTHRRVQIQGLPLGDDSFPRPFFVIPEQSRGAFGDHDDSGVVGHAHARVGIGAEIPQQVLPFFFAGDDFAHDVKGRILGSDHHVRHFQECRHELDGQVSRTGHGQPLRLVADVADAQPYRQRIRRNLKTTFEVGDGAAVRIHDLYVG